MSRARNAYLRAFEELLSARPFASITASDVIARSGYGRTSFYRHFSDKYALAAELVRGEARAYAHLLAHDLADEDFDMGRVVLHLLRHVGGRKGLYHAILRSSIPGQGFDEFCAYALEAFRTEGVASPSLSVSELDYDLYYYATTRQLADYVRYWEREDFATPADEMAAHITDVIAHLTPGSALTFCRAES